MAISTTPRTDIAAQGLFSSSAGAKVISAAVLLVISTLLALNKELRGEFTKIKSKKRKYIIYGVLLVFALTQTGLIGTAVSEKAKQENVKESIGWVSITLAVLIPLSVIFAVMEANA